MEKRPLISIITCCFNSDKTITKTLESIKCQSFQDFELIVIDGGSSDKTIDIINKNRNIISKVISEKDKGVYDAMNKGIKHSSGEIVGFLNSDDFFTNEKVLEEIASNFISKKIDIIYGDLIYVDRENTNKIIRKWKSSEINLKKLKKGWIPAHPTFYARNEVYSDLGAFNLEYKLAADYECMLRILLNEKYKQLYIPKVLVTMRLGGMTSKNFRNRILQNKEIIWSWKRNTGSIPNLFIINRLMIKFSQFLLN